MGLVIIAHHALDRAASLRQRGIEIVSWMSYRPVNVRCDVCGDTGKIRKFGGYATCDCAAASNVDSDGPSWDR